MTEDGLGKCLEGVLSVDAGNNEELTQMQMEQMSTVLVNFCNVMVARNPKFDGTRESHGECFTSAVQLLIDNLDHILKLDNAIDDMIECCDRMRELNDKKHMGFKPTLQ